VSHDETANQRRRPMLADPTSDVVRPSCEALRVPTMTPADAIHGSHHKNGY
jgi:hypothetical protein